MRKKSRKQRRRILQEAEGLLELAVLFDNLLPLEQGEKNRLSDLCLETLAQIEADDGYTARVCYLRGQAHRLAERYADAIPYLLRAQELDPTNLHNYLALGWCYKRTQQIDSAIRVMQQGLQIETHSGILHYNLACYLALLKQTRPAITHLASAIAIDTHFQNLAHSETDFDPIRDDPEFQSLVEAVV